MHTSVSRPVAVRRRAALLIGTMAAASLAAVFVISPMLDGVESIEIRDGQLRVQLKE